jgi:hypothetical protein
LYIDVFIYSDWQALIYENDVRGESSLRRISSSNRHIRLMSETLHFPYSKKLQQQQRCGRPRLMAFLRQRLLSSIQQVYRSSLLSSSSIDLILYFDLDLIGNNGVDVRPLARTICQRQYDQGWDVLCGLGMGRTGAYFDTFALRPCDVDFYHKVHHFDTMPSAYSTDLSPFLQPNIGFIVFDRVLVEWLFIELTCSPRRHANTMIPHACVNMFHSIRVLYIKDMIAFLSIQQCLYDIIPRDETAHKRARNNNNG